MQAFFKPGSVVLFQGDSVTDCGRTREADLPLGNGYARKVADIYTELFPQQQLTFAPQPLPVEADELFVIGTAGASVALQKG